MLPVRCLDGKEFLKRRSTAHPQTRFSKTVLKKARCLVAFIFFSLGLRRGKGDLFNSHWRRLLEKVVSCLEG